MTRGLKGILASEFCQAIKRNILPNNFFIAINGSGLDVVQCDDTIVQSITDDQHARIEKIAEKLTSLMNEAFNELPETNKEAVSKALTTAANKIKTVFVTEEEKQTLGLEG